VIANASCRRARYRQGERHERTNDCSDIASGEKQEVLLFLRFRRFGLFLALACPIAGMPTPALSASRDACSLVTRADVGAAVGGGAVTPGKLRRYQGETSSQCHYDTAAGNVVVAVFPDGGDRLFASVQASYGSLQVVPGMGDDAVYSKQHGTLAIRKGRSAMLLTLATPDAGRGHAILMALGHRVAARLP
jgi:hypothetical protein